MPVLLGYFLIQGKTIDIYNLVKILNVGGFSKTMVPKFQISDDYKLPVRTSCVIRFCTRSQDQQKNKCTHYS